MKKWWRGRCRNTMKDKEEAEEETEKGEEQGEY